MLKNHLKIAFRQLGRNKVFSIINILGLSLGMAMAILIAVFVKEEFSYDNWMTDSNLTYRVFRNWNGDGGTVWTPGPLVEKLVSDYPEVAEAAAFTPWGADLITYEDQSFYVEESAQVDSAFFQVLGMNFLHGNPQTAMKLPNNVVLTDRLATKIFGDSNPINQTLTLDGTEEYIVSGVLDTENKKSHIIADIYTRFDYWGSSWTGNNRFTYVRLNAKADQAALESKMTKDISKLIEQEYLSQGYTPTADNIPKWRIQPLNEVYLYSDNHYTLGVQEGSMRNIYIFLSIGLVILLVAIINYINLTTARASQRGKEVGVKKVAGAGRSLLTTQFITESILQAFIAGGFAILLAEICLPFFNNITDRNIELLTGTPLFVLAGLTSLALLTGLLAGAYPAFVMAAYKPVKALKSNFLKAGDNGLFRKVLVTSQFAATITLLIVMAFIYRQVNFMMDKDLGFQPDQVITIPLNSDASHRRLENIKARFLRIPGVQEVTTASHFPGGFLPDYNIMIQGRTEGENPNIIFADGDFANTLDIQMVEGRFIDNTIGADSTSNFVVNETFVRQYNIEEPLGAKIKFTSDSLYGQIVGVMKDFHFQSINYTIRPLLMNANHWRQNAGIRLSTENISSTINAIQEVWAEVEPHHPMRYTFLDEEFAEQYADQQRFGETILYATLLTLFIALLGLFGLTAFTVERRHREIGIRKVLGASVSGIVGLLAQDFMKLVGFAALIAIPAGFVLVNNWLQDFPERTKLVWWIFAGAGVIILLIGFLTVCLQSVKAAMANPIHAIKSE
ncbi:MAG: ABC transporter permease [Bacteroidota bacterium]